MLQKTTLLLKKAFLAGPESKDGWVRGHELKQLSINYRMSSVVLDQAHPGLYDPEKDGEFCDPYRSGGVGGLRAGDRAPDGPGLVPVQGPMTMSILALFGAYYHTVLVFSTEKGLIEKALKSLEAYPKGLIRTAVVIPKGAEPPALPSGVVEHVLEDHAGHAYSNYDSVVKSSHPIIVVRPDGAIGAVVKDADGIREYFRLILA
jgi:hypothetical protein